MQLTRIDRWLLEEFVHETHIYTLSAPSSIPRGIREVPLPDTPGRRFQHHFVATNGKKADALVAVLREGGQMFSTQVVDRKAWYVPIIGRRGVSFTWMVVWIISACSGLLTAASYLHRLSMNPEFRKNLSDAIEVFKG